MDYNLPPMHLVLWRIQNKKNKRCVYAVAQTAHRAYQRAAPLLSNADETSPGFAGVECSIADDRVWNDAVEPARRKPRWKNS